MQRCSHCQSQQLDGTMFCTACGASMLGPVRQSTTLINPQPTQLHRQQSSELTDTATHETRLALTVIPTGRRLQPPAAEELLIGRRDEARGILPDIDLSDDGGYDAGVSRRHAIISRREDTYFIEDLGSANGTFLNDRQIDAQQLVRLSNGDELRCGMLALRIELSP